MEEREKKQRLKAVGEEITRLKEQREEVMFTLGLKKVNDLEEYFTNPGVSVETLGEKLSSACPWLDLGEIATNGPTANQDQGSVQTREQLHYTDKDFDDLKNKVFAKDNNKVDVLEFPGLKEAIENARGNVPDYLQPIASKIERDRGTPTGFELFNIQLLVCAAINEMEDLAVEKLDSRTLLKWGATLNKAKQFDFQVKSADNLLEKSFYAYIGYSKKSSEIRG
ncbi:uncharacterized protein LOC111297804 [Durio zibethinus]|uniref:Uncharacterized protein LOC111297804 n=1 Tax=Durio zibethinus TaxID=66656 RepID=A0A6P5Z607_DURZI|nr:uncharacterized protein LOC111297804 [Durio zibethinus]